MSVTATTDRLFGKNDIRGIVGPNFNEQTYYQLGRAYAAWMVATQTHAGLSRDLPPWVAVGHDVRHTSPAFYEALIRGLTDEGLNVVRLGMVPSPLVYFAEVWHQDEASARVKNQTASWPPLAGGLVVTASHNPPAYNGLKMTWHGKPLSADDIQALKQQFNTLGHTQPGSGAGGQQQTVDIYPVYRAWAHQQLPALATPITVVVDCGNAVGGLITPQVLAATGARVIPLFAEPDGHFPNHHPDPCVSANLTDLIRTVKDTGADLGIALDGDGDRLGVVDGSGRIVSGDFLLLLYTEALMNREKNRQPVTVVTEVKCSRHLFSTLEAAGATVILCPTGHSYMKQAMRQHQAALGGELSGHFFFRDEHWGFDDATYAALRLLRLVDDWQHAHPGQHFADRVAQLPATCISDEIRVPCAPERREPAMEQIRQAWEQAYTHQASLPVPVGTAGITVDGLRIQTEDGFWLVRPSNTEACFTLRCEAADPASLADLQTRLIAWVSEICKG